MANESKVSTQLISHLQTFRHDKWDAEVLRRTELCLLDSLACFSGGLSLKHVAPSVTAVQRLFGAGAGTTPPSQLSPFIAAYLYGQAANALDYDDTLLIGHPGAPIIGAVLAVAARARLSTDQVLRGIAAGYQTEMVLNAAATPSRERAALVRSVGVWDAVAGSIGAGVALGFDDAMLERVIGVALVHSLLPYTAKWFDRPVPGTKNNMGWAAAGAVLSTELALAGQTGVTNPLDGEAGMWRMAGSDRWNLDWSMFEKPAVLRSGFKHVPGCWHLQVYLKTLEGLLASVAPDDDIVEIVLTGPPEIEKFCDRNIVHSADIAFSLPAGFSLLISQIEPGPEWYSEDSLANHLHYKDVFRYEQSEGRSLSLRTRKGQALNSAVGVGDVLDWAPWGLDEPGVVAKHDRLTDPELRAGAAAALAAVGGVPDRLYGAINGMMVNQYRNTESN